MLSQQREEPCHAYEISQLKEFRDLNLEILLANFICQIDWTLGCPDFWLNIMLWFLQEQFE